MLENKKTLEELQKKMCEYRFALNETALYLDTHPNDLDVLERHNYHSKLLYETMAEYEELSDEPLCLYGQAEGFWTYINSWPWERER